MKNLLILRHAKSSWEVPGQDDHERPLNSRGIRDAPRMGQLLRRERLLPGLILCSSAVRARQTVERVIEAGGLDGELQVRSELYLADPRAYLALLFETLEIHETVMVVGHNPGLVELIGQLTGGSREMPTAALAHIRLPIESWSELDTMPVAELAGFWKPKSLPADL